MNKNVRNINSLDLLQFRIQKELFQIYYFCEEKCINPTIYHLQPSSALFINHYFLTQEYTNP